MARSTSTRKARTNHKSEEQSQSSVAVISAPDTLQDEIRARAYELYEQDGRVEGRDQEYWLRAENEILERYGLRRA